MKTASLGQVIMQTTCCRVLLAPLQPGLSVQMHHHFASHFLINTLSHHGFSCQYTEVQKFEKNAALVQGTDIPGLLPSTFVQYAADNVDHNIQTLD